MKKMFLSMTAATLFFIQVSITACAGKGQEIVQQTVQQSISTERVKEEEGMNHTDNGLAGIADRIDSVNFYEITENQFQKGVDFDLQEEDLEKLKEIVRSDSLTIMEEQCEKKDIKYVLCVYDEKENEIASFGIDRSGSIFIDDSRRVKDEEFEALIQALAAHK